MHYYTVHLFQSAVVFGVGAVVIVVLFLLFSLHCAIIRGQSLVCGCEVWKRYIQMDVIHIDTKKEE